MNLALISGGCSTCELVSEKLEDFSRRMVTPEKQRIVVTLNRYDVEALRELRSAAEIFQAKLQVLIVSQEVLDTSENEGRKLSIGRLLDPKKAIIVATKLKPTQLKQYFESDDELSGTDRNWFILELEEDHLDPKFLEAFANQVLKIYNAELAANSTFSLFPKKISNEQPKVSILLKRPIQEYESFVVGFTKGGLSEFVEDVVPSRSLLVRLPESFCHPPTSLVEVSVAANGETVGSKVIKYEHVGDETQEDYLEKLLKDLPGFRDFLDDQTSEALSTNFANGRDWTEDTDLRVVQEIMALRAESLPTLMHFAAFYNLPKTVDILLSETEGFGSCATQNDKGETPLDLANEAIRQTITETYELRKSCKLYSEFKRLMTEKALPARGTKNEDEFAALNKSYQILGGIQLSESVGGNTDTPQPENSQEHFYVNDVTSDLGTASGPASLELSGSYYENVKTPVSSPTKGGATRDRMDSNGDELESLMHDYENDVDGRQKCEVVLRQWDNLNHGPCSPRSRAQRLSQLRDEFVKIKEESVKAKPSLLSRICSFFGRRKRRVHEFPNTQLEVIDLEAVQTENWGSTETNEAISSATIVDEGVTSSMRKAQRIAKVERVKWKLSPLPHRKGTSNIEWSPQRPQSPSASKQALPMAVRKLKQQGIRTPPETPQRPRVTEDDYGESKPCLPSKSKLQFVSPLSSPRAGAAADGGVCTNVEPGEVRQHYYKVPPVPVPINFPPHVRKCKSSDML